PGRRPPHPRSAAPHAPWSRPRGLPARGRTPVRRADRSVRPRHRGRTLGAGGARPRPARPRHRHRDALAGARRRACRSRAAHARPSRSMTVAIIPVPGVPMVRPGDDLAAQLGDAIEASRVGVKPHDVIVVCQKVVSKAEGAVVDLKDVEASAFAEQLAARTTTGKDPRAYEVVLREANRIVRMDRGHVIVETRHGWVCANAGVDESNGLGPGVLT